MLQGVHCIEAVRRQLHQQQSDVYQGPWVRLLHYTLDTKAPNLPLSAESTGASG